MQRSVNSCDVGHEGEDTRIIRRTCAHNLFALLYPQYLHDPYTTLHIAERESFIDGHVLADETHQVEVLKKIEKLKYNPYAGKNLKGALNNFLSLKVWPYRIIYQYSDSDKVIFIKFLMKQEMV